MKRPEQPEALQNGCWSVTLLAMGAFVSLPMGFAIGLVNWLF